MTTNLDAYRADLERLIADGEQLQLGIEYQCLPKPEKAKLAMDPRNVKVLDGLPSFREVYQTWYSEAVVLLRQLLPDRLADFVRHYQKPKSRREITFESYRIEDYLQGLMVRTHTGLGEEVVGGGAAIPHFRQQLAIVRAVAKRFESTLFDIRQLVQADLFDSELEAAAALQNAGFLRASGALAGVVLERHLKQVCQNHQITIAKKKMTISDCNNALKSGNVIDVPQWRHIQLLGDIRNQCDHSEKDEPTNEQIADLLAGVAKFIKTVF